MPRNEDWSPERTSKVKKLVRRLYETVSALEDEFKEDKRKFTPDGHLVGSIGEVVAAYAFDLKLYPASTPIHDAESKDKRKVQIKLTGGKRGVSLYGKPDHLLVLQLNEGEIKLVYNGPGLTIWNECGSENKRNGQRTISLSQLTQLNKKVATHDSLDQCRPFPALS